MAQYLVFLLNKLQFFSLTYLTFSKIGRKMLRRIFRSRKLHWTRKFFSSSSIFEINVQKYQEIVWQCIESYRDTRPRRGNKLKQPTFLLSCINFLGQFSRLMPRTFLSLEPRRTTAKQREKERLVWNSIFFGKIELEVYYSINNYWPCYAGTARAVYWHAPNYAQ